MSYESKEQRYKAYLRTISIWIIGVGICVFIEKPYAETEIKEVFEAISNCFVVPGVILAGLAGLSLMGNHGAYDSFGYMFSKFSLHNILPTSASKSEKHESLYDYKQAKAKKRQPWRPHMLVVGLASLGLGVLALIVYFIL